MIESIGNWLMVVASAAFGSTIIGLLSPPVRSGLNKYVRFASACAVLATVCSPLFGLLADVQQYFNNAGIFSYDENINITEQQNQSAQWVLSQTLTSLEEGIVKLVREKYHKDINVCFDTDITQEGIVIQRIRISAPEGTVYANQLEIAEFLQDYLDIEVKVEKNGG